MIAGIAGIETGFSAKPRKKDLQGDFYENGVSKPAKPAKSRFEGIICPFNAGSWVSIQIGGES